MLNMAESGRRRLAEMIVARRRELGLSVRMAAGAAGINRASWAAWEAGAQTISVHSRAGLEAALRWAPGSIDAILDGGEPVAAPEDGQRRVTRRAPLGRSAREEDSLILEIRGNPALTDDQKLTLEQIVRRANADREMVEERLRRQAG